MRWKKVARHLDRANAEGTATRKAPVAAQAKAQAAT